jgi:hypothetical protein
MKTELFNLITALAAGSAVAAQWETKQPAPSAGNNP